MMAESPSGDHEALLHSLQVASQSWSTFDLDSRRPLWDRSAAQTKENREQSLTARKQLADHTKQFKKSVKATESAASAATLDAALKGNFDTLAKECRSVVKAYQEEIDNLTRRCKASDTSFLNLYQGIYELPDPATLLVPALQQLDSQQVQIQNLLQGMEELNGELGQTQQRLQEAQQSAQTAAQKSEDSSASGSLSKAEREEILQLRREVAEYEVEFRGLKNQDITIRKLEAKIVELQKNSEEELQTELKKARQDLAETEGRRATEALEREAAMERRVQTLELQLRAERAGREATQSHLLEAHSGAGEREAAWEAQRQILVDDSERVRETLHLAMKERDELRLRVAALDGHEDAHPATPSSGGISVADFIAERKAYEAEVSELSHTANSLREELRIKEKSMDDENQTLQATIDSLERERSRLSSSVVSLEAQLACVPSQESVAKMKRELRILKQLEYNAVDVDAEKEPEMTSSPGANEGGEEDLEGVLVAKLRKVESDLVRERNESGERAKECLELKRQLSAMEKAKEEAEKLVASLEADLHRAISTPSTTPSLSRKNSGPPVAPSDPSALQTILDPTAPLPPPPIPAAESDGVGNASNSATEKANDDHSVATIVMAQRDRLRARCEALEAERDSFKKELQVQVQSAESLKADNTKLYEKVRYLQNFSNTNTGRSGYSHRDRDLDLEALEQRYEASVDPFRQFSRAERQRKMQEMSPMERVVFIVAKTVLGSKEMRTALFFYVLGMHLLVFITTYHWSHEMGCHDLHLHKDLAHFHGGVPLENAPNETPGDAKP